MGIRNAGGSIFTMMSTQLPFTYVHLVSFICHMYLFILATYCGFIHRTGAQLSLCLSPPPCLAPSPAPHAALRSPLTLPLPRCTSLHASLALPTGCRPGLLLSCCLATQCTSLRFGPPTPSLRRSPYWTGPHAGIPGAQWPIDLNGMSADVAHGSVPLGTWSGTVFTKHTEGNLEESGPLLRSLLYTCAPFRSCETMP